MSTLSIQFLSFLVVVFIVYWITKGKYRKLVLLACSILYLVSFGKIIHWLYASFLILYVFIVDKLIAKNSKDKLILFAKIVPIILGLCFFKYAGIFEVTGLIMPIGISFYTFKTISYLVDVHNDKINSQNFCNLAIYILFFPVFTAGPINRPDGFFKQIDQTKAFDYHNQKNGAVLTAMGLFQKLVFADYFSIIVSSIFSNKELTGWYLILGVILYAFQLYIDFDAYSNIAIGISKMLGIEVEKNFRQPYLAISIKDFWARWHISLSSWLRDYIYIPLGGSRKGNIRKYLNILIIFMISGMWHGSTLVFVLWGLGHGLVNIVEDVLLPKSPAKIPAFVKVLMILFNFVIVSLLWVFFRSENVNEVIRVISNMFVISGFDLQIINLTQRQGVWMIIILVIVILTDILRNKRDMIEWLSQRKMIVRWSLYAIMIFVAIIFGIYGSGYDARDFIYVTF